MTKALVWTFFYGSYINFDVLEEAGFDVHEHEVARLDGFDIRIRPLANVVRSEGKSVYGIVALSTHDALDRLYAHARNVLGGVYLPEAVVVETRSGELMPALCYIDPMRCDEPATPEYIDRIVKPARAYGFPDWYVERLERFRP